MRMRYWLFTLLALAAITLAGCNDTTTSPRLSAPAAPRGLYSISGDTADTLVWLANTEPNIQGYRVYMSTCATACPYTRVGTTTGTWFIVTGLTNGQTRFFAVAAVGPDGQEGPLSYETVYDTPRPEGAGAAMVNMVGAVGTGWDFANVIARPTTNLSLVDIVYRDSLALAQICVVDTATKIQDMGYTSSLNVIDYAPSTGWSPSGRAEAIYGHCYVVRTRTHHFAKIRVTSVSTGSVIFDWAYQTDAGNGELNAKPSTGMLTAGRGTVAQR